MSTLAEKRNLNQEIQSAFLLPGFEKDPKRKHALNLFLRKGFPGPKSEEYKFTPITRLLEGVLILDPIQPSLKMIESRVPAIKDFTCNLIAFVNGQFSREQSIILDEDVSIQLVSLEEAQIESDPFDHLNQAFSHSVVQISLFGKRTHRAYANVNSSLIQS